MTNQTTTSIGTNITTMQRRLVELAVAGTAVVVWNSANDSYNMVKLSLLAVLVVGLLASEVWRTLDRGEVAVPRAWSMIPLGAFLALGAVSVVTSDVTWRSLYGAYGRSTGFLLYLGCAVVLLGVLRSVQPAAAPRVVRTIVVASGIIALYGILQRVGVDPWESTGLYGPDAATSTLGNTNFVSGYLGAVVPLALWAAIATRGRVRAASTVAAVAIAIGIVATGSQQGFIAAAGGTGVLAVGLVLEHGGQRRRTLLAALAAASLVGIAVVGLGVIGSGPLKRLQDTGADFRRYYWSAAIEMASDAPLEGVGFDRWGAHYRSVRSEEAATTGALGDVTDAPHSVPLNMFASGGIPLGVAYLAFIAAVGWSLLLGLRRSVGPDRLLLAAVGGAWVGYQVQSAVSIDVPALPVLHFALAGLVLVLSGAVRWSTRAVPVLVKRTERHISKKNVVVRESPRFRGAPAAAIAAVLAIIGVWQVTRPLRADVEVREAQSTSDPSVAVDRFRSAIATGPWEPEYYSVVGEHFGRQQAAQVALAYFERAVAKDPLRFADTLNGARAAQILGDISTGDELFGRALSLEPHAVELKLELARYYAATDRPDLARPFIDAAIAAKPEDRVTLEVLATVHAVAGQLDEAFAVYERVGTLLRSDDVGGFIELAGSLRRIGRYDAARAMIARALAATPRHEGARYELARIAEDDGEIAEALELYDGLENDFPGRFDAADRAAALRAEGSS